MLNLVAAPALRHWKLVGLALLVALLALQTVRIGGLKDKLETCRAKHKIIEAESQARQDRVRTVVKEGEKQIVTVERKVRELVDRPVPGACRTPDLNEWKEML